jgi:hypothetical protein
MIRQEEDPDSIIHAMDHLFDRPFSLPCFVSKEMADGLTARIERGLS